MQKIFLKLKNNNDYFIGWLSLPNVNNQKN